MYQVAITGDEWWDKIVEELTTRDVFIIVLSPNSIVSHWVRLELDTAINEGIRIIPVLYQPCKVRADLKIRQIISFAPPKDYDTAFNELLRALGLPALPRQPYIQPDISRIIPVYRVPQPPNIPPSQQEQSRGWMRIVLIAAAALIVLGIVGISAFFLFQPQNVGPSDNTSFTIKITVQIKDAVTGEQLDPLHETLIITGHPDGGSVCQSRDNGQPQSLPNTIGTGVFKCNGIYKGGKLSYIETASSIQYTISGGTTCQSNLSFAYERLDGTFSNQNTISGTFSSDAYTLACSNGGSINANAQTGTWNGTLIQGGSTIVLVRFNPFVMDQPPW